MRTKHECRGGLYALPTTGTGLRHAIVATATQAGGGKPLPYTGNRLLKFLNISLGRWLLAPVLCFSMATSAPAPLIYRPGQGWEVEGKEAVEETSKAQLEKGERYEKDKKFDEASQAYRALVKTWPLSPNAPEAQFRYAEVLYKLYDFQRSFKEFQTCLEKYPDSEHYEESLKRQYDIACLFLAGERLKIWKIPTMPSMDKTVEMFEKTIKNGPYSPVAPMAQLKIGFAREKQHQWENAVKAYRELIRRYPKSDLADDAQFQIGYAYMLASREADYDQTATNRAITGFEDYITKYPKSEKIEQARENIERLKHEQGRGYMTIAEFYDRQKNYDAALIYYNNVIQKFPGSDLAKRATVRAEELKKRQTEAVPDLQKTSTDPQKTVPNTETNAPPLLISTNLPPTVVEIEIPPPPMVNTNAPPPVVKSVPLATPTEKDSAPSIFDDDFPEATETNSPPSSSTNHSN